MAEATEYLRITDLHAFYGESHILHGVDLTVNNGEVVTLLGRNGAGRTTTLKSILGLVGRRTGSIMINGTEAIGLPPHRIAQLGLGYCPEERGIFLSGGEQQMLAMGRALMARPRLLLLDEPSMGLSPIMVDKVFEVIGAIHRQGTTVLLVEQNASRALAISDRAYVMESGEMTMSGPAAELRRDPRVRAAYLGQEPE